MRPRVDWMTGSDDTVLEVLAELPEGFYAPPKAIEVNARQYGVSIAKSTVDSRLKKLVAAELVEYLPQPLGYCRITDKGRSYLTGELEPEELRISEVEYDWR